MRIYKYKLLFTLIIRIFLPIIFIFIIIGCGIYYNKLFEALMVIVMVLQFELAYRQYWLNKIHEEPMFKLVIYKMTKESLQLQFLTSDNLSKELVNDLNSNEVICLKIKNIGSTPAYYVTISRVLNNKGALSPKFWKKYVKTLLCDCLVPHSESLLALIDKQFYENYLNNGIGTIELSYINCYGELNNIEIAFYEVTPVIKLQRKTLPGIFLTIPEYIEVLKILIYLRKIEQKTSQKLKKA